MSVSSRASGRPCMTTSCVLAGVLLAVAPLHAQRYEATVWLPDSLCGIGWPCHLAYNSTSGRVYVAGRESGGVVAFDAATHRKGGRWNTGYQVSDVAWSRTYNRVYSADYGANTVTVADGRTGLVIATIAGTLEHPYSLMLDESRDKLYVACDYDIAVVDLATSSITRSISIPDSPGRMIPDTLRDRYCILGWHDSLYFVDADADTVFRVMPLPSLRGQTLLALNTRNDRLYCTGNLSESLAVVDLTTDSLVRSVAIPFDPSDIVWNDRENLLYVSAHDPGLVVVDCTKDSVVDTVYVYDAQDIEFDTLRNRLYVCSSRPGVTGAPSYLVVVDCGTQTADTAILVGSRLTQARWIPDQDVVYIADGEDPDIAVLDGATLSQSARSEVGTKVATAVWNSIDNRLYTANARSPCISVIDGSSLAVIDTIGVSYAPFDLCWVPGNNKLYCTTQRDVDIWVIDCGTNSPLACLPGHNIYNHMAFSPASNKLYCSHYTAAGQDSGLVTVIDGTTNQVLTTITTGPSTTRLFWYADSNWMFCTRYLSIAAIDCHTDSILTTITGVRGPTEMVYNPTNHSIYCACEDGLLIIDAPTRQIRKRLNIGMVYPLALNSRRNVIYCSAAWSGELSVIDCTTDSIIATTQYEPAGYPVGLLWNYLNDKVYLVLNSWENAVVTFDAATNRFLDTLTMRGWPSGIAWDPASNRTYVPNWDGSSVSVLRDDPPGIAEGYLASPRRSPVLPTLLVGTLRLSGSGPVTLYDIGGRQVARFPAESKDRADRRFDLGYLSPGVYFVRHESAWYRQTHKLVIAR